MDTPALLFSSLPHRCSRRKTAPRAFECCTLKIQSRSTADSMSQPGRKQILLDAYHDRRNAYRFAVNPLGTQQDALITDEGRDINLSWDAPWISAGRIDETGWTVEIEIPLTTVNGVISTTAREMKLQPARRSGQTRISYLMSPTVSTAFVCRKGSLRRTSLPVESITTSHGSC
jgi:hypothetical protein